MKKIYALCVALLVCALVKAQTNNLTLLGYLDYAPYSVAGVWQYVDTAGNEYAIVGAENRLSIVNVTNPANLIEVANVPANAGEESLWREVKTAGNYAYAVSEGGGGVIIVDLSALPAVTYKHWYGDSVTNHLFNTAHTIAATDGFIYIFGSSYGNGGCLIADISDPWNPQYVGLADQRYIHDGYIRNDTLWAGEIYAGQFAVIDVSTKSNPIYLATQPTPGAFNHNTWLSESGQYLYTTDEYNNTPVGAFDVSDVNNIQLVSTRFNDTMPNEEVHNVRVLNDFLINPSYGSQLTIWDAARPANMIEIANYTTGNFLCWDASPYLPSKNIITTDTYGGFYVFAPNYVRASYLEGNVIDSVTGISLNNVTVKIIGTSKETKTALTGGYKTGIAGSGTYDIEFSKAGYLTQTFNNVSLASGVVTLINVKMVAFTFTGQVVDAINFQTIANAKVHIDNGSVQLNLVADASGNFSTNTLSSGIYTITVSKWGYKTSCNNYLVNAAPLVLPANSGYLDDFSSDDGWNVTSTVTTGAWVRAVPKGTLYGTTHANPDVDVSNDCNNLCYVTGNTGTTANSDDVDDGITTLTSPLFDLTSYNDPYISYARWFFIQQSVNPANSDTLFIRLSNGITSAIIEIATLNTPLNSTWVDQSFRIANYITPTANMQLSVSISDKIGQGNLLEAGFDRFEISESTGLNDAQNQNKLITIQPNPFTSEFKIHINKPISLNGMQIKILDISGREIMHQNIFTYDAIINTSALNSNGIYLLQLSDETGYIEMVKLVKSN